MQRLGDMVRELRQQRRLSQERLAARAGVTARTLRNWETDRQLPRDVELERILTALDVTEYERIQVLSLLPDPRRLRLERLSGAVHVVPPALLGSLPGIGDLVRAMRHRQGWTQEQLAERMRVNRGTVIRWEATRILPSDEDMERICTVLQAHEEERAALRARRLSPSSWPSRMTLEECRQQYEVLLPLQLSFSRMAIPDLQFLALKRQLRQVLHVSPEALLLLVNLEVQHSRWLFIQDRVVESCAGNWRALRLARDRLTPNIYWLWALNLLSAHAARGAQGAENGVKLLYPWLRLLPRTYHALLLCDMAYYAGQAQRHNEAETFLKQAQRAMTSQVEDDAVVHFHYCLTEARVLLSCGKAIEALECLPAPQQEGSGRVHELTVWAEAYLAAGERSMATRYIDEALALLEDMPWPRQQQKLQVLAQRL